MLFNNSKYPELQIRFADISAEQRFIPNSGTIFATEQSLPLYALVLGSDSYQRSLRSFCDALLTELMNGSAAEHTISRRFRQHAVTLALIVHSLAHVGSNWPRLKAVAVPRRHESYGKGSTYQHLARDQVKRLCSLLVGGDGTTFGGETTASALCKGMPGYFDRSAGHGVVSRIVPKTELLDRLVRAGLVFPDHPFDKRQPYDSSAPVLTLNGMPLVRDLIDDERIIPVLNQMLAATAATISYRDFDQYKKGYRFRDKQHMGRLCATQLHRAFKYDEESGGRLFGHAVQSVPRVLRSSLLLDGDPVVELDYSAMQPNLAYSILGLRCPSGDPYRVPGYESEEHRVQFKFVFVTGMGADEHTNPVSALALNWHRRTGSWLQAETARLMDQDFWDHHHAIRQFRGSQAWRRLQLMESQVCLKVLRQLVDKEIVCIPIHDSFVVKKRHETQLKQAMIAAVLHLSSPPEIHASR